MQDFVTVLKKCFDAAKEPVDFKYWSQLKVWKSSSEIKKGSSESGSQQNRSILGSLGKDDGNSNYDARKQWSDWLNEEK